MQHVTPGSRWGTLFQAGDLVAAVPEEVGPPLPPCPAPGDAPGAVAAEAAMQPGASVAGAGGASGEARWTGCAEGPIVMDSDVDTDDDSGEFGGAPDGSFAIGPTSLSPTQPNGKPSRFTGRKRPGWKSASARGPVRGAAVWDHRTGVVGRVYRIYKGPLALRWNLVVRRPCDPPPPHGVRLAAVKWPHQKGSHLRKGVAPEAAGLGGRRRRKAQWRIPSWQLQSASRPGHGERGGGGGGWWRPDPRVAGLDRGDMVQEMAPLYLEFMQTLTPHFHWIAATQRCGL